MADTKITALTQNTAPLGSDMKVMVDDPNGTPLTQYIYNGTDNLLPEGWMMNGKISVTVASNNITLALKTKSGGNPSATDPVSVWINGSFRTCTAALSVTLAAGTNWFNSGSSGAASCGLATNEIDYFAYLIWNTTPATDIMDIGFARKPYYSLYSDASATTTSENYLAYGNGSAPTATDSMVNIGRFAATLSATASFNWSVPTYTNSNLKQYPSDRTRELVWTPAHSRTGGAYSNAPTVNEAKYVIQGRQCNIFEKHTQNAVPGSSGNQTITMPFASALASAITILSCLNANSAAFLSVTVPTASITGTMFTVAGGSEATASNSYSVNGVMEI